MARYLTDLADIARAAGLKVVEMPGWKTRGRPQTETQRFNPRAVLCHHTAGTSDSVAYVEWMIAGRTDLKGPLAQLALSRTGIVYVMAAGRANHGGTCKAFSTTPAGDGNEHYVGIEAMNTGFEGWSPAQYGAYVRLCAALNNAYGWKASTTAGHKETSLSGKIDPGKMSMPDFRADVARDMVALTDAGPPPETGPGEYPGTALRRGSTGPKVVELQTALGLTADGSYGPGTEAAVRAFQTANGLEADGVTGPATWASIFQEDDLTAEDTARIKTIEEKLAYLIDVEAGRYTVSTGRYGHLVSLSQGIAAKVGAPVDIDEAALAAHVAAVTAPLVAEAVAEAAKAQGIPNADTLADAVVSRLGAKLTTPEKETA